MTISCPSYVTSCLQSVPAFVVFSDIKTMAKKVTGIESLSNELLHEILDHIEADPEKSIDVHRRAYLSVESFKPPPLPSPGQAEAIGNFRRVCKRFSELGIPYQFTRLATRFSTAGFERLRCIAERPHLARAVKKFTYLVPLFYVDGMTRVHHADLVELILEQDARN